MKILNDSYLEAFREVMEDNPPSECILGIRASSLTLEGYQRFVETSWKYINAFEAKGFYDEAFEKEREKLLRWVEYEGAFAVIFSEQVRGHNEVGGHMSYSSAWGMNEDIYNQLMKHL